MYKNSLIAKFGNDESVPEFRTGDFKDDENNTLKVSFMHLPKQTRVKKIVFKWIDCKLSKLLSNNTIYTKFNIFFLDSDLKLVGGFKTIGEFVDLQLLRKEKNIQLKFENERTQEFILADNELIVGLDMGLDKNGNIVDLKFILAALGADFST